MKKRAKSKFYMATCRGCLERIPQSHWENHPLTCKNFCYDKRIKEFQLENKKKNIRKSKIKQEIEALMEPIAQ